MRMANALTLLLEFLMRTLWISWAVTPSMAWDSGLKQKYDGYGEDWIFMPDGKGQPQVAVLKVVHPDGRGVLDESIGFILYTRYNDLPLFSLFSITINNIGIKVVFCRNAVPFGACN